MATTHPIDQARALIEDSPLFEYFAMSRATGRDIAKEPPFESDSALPRRLWGYPVRFDDAVPLGEVCAVRLDV